jgi:hypothetical protein
MNSQTKMNHGAVPKCSPFHHGVTESTESTENHGENNSDFFHPSHPQRSSAFSAVPTRSRFSVFLGALRASVVKESIPRARRVTAVKVSDPEASHA